jgi:hypothetical protein
MTRRVFAEELKSSFSVRNTLHHGTKRWQHLRCAGRGILQHLRRYTERRAVRGQRGELPIHVGSGVKRHRDHAWRSPEHVTVEAIEHAPAPARFREDSKHVVRKRAVQQTLGRLVAHNTAGKERRGGGALNGEVIGMIIPAIAGRR